MSGQPKHGADFGRWCEKTQCRPATEEELDTAVRFADWPQMVDSSAVVRAILSDAAYHRNLVVKLEAALLEAALKAKRCEDRNGTHEMGGSMSGKFETYAILEIMGHQTFAGYVSEQEIAGQAFIRIDVPAIEGAEAWTKYFGPSSVYGITPVTKEVAELRAEALGKLPMTAWDLPMEVREKIRRADAAALPAPDAGEGLKYQPDDDAEWEDN